MHYPSGVTVVLLYIIKTFRVAFSLLLSLRRLAGSKLQVAPLSSWNLIVDLSMLNVPNIFFACFQSLEELISSLDSTPPDSSSINYLHLRLFPQRCLLC